MPDQHTAATEHALISKIAEPLDKLPHDPLRVVAVDFPVALRGYDRFAVDAYVEQTAQLVAELQSTRSPEAAVRRALERVGEEISGILTRAHDTADEITSRSRAEAEERLEAARQEATALTARAERRVKDLDAETERIWAERHSIVTDARELARRLTELAESALERFPADAAPVDLSSGGLAAPGQAHPFDGAADEQYPPLPGSDHQDDGVLGEVGDEPTAVQPTADEAAVVVQPVWADPAVGGAAVLQPAPPEPVTEETAVVEPEWEEPAGAEPTWAEPADGEATPEEHDDPQAAMRTIVDEPTAVMPPIEPWEERPLTEPWEGRPTAERVDERPPNGPWENRPVSDPWPADGRPPGTGDS